MFSRVLLLMLSIPVVVKAQHQPALVVLARYDEKGMLLRWAPGSPQVWEMGNRFGYVIERKTIGDDGEVVANADYVITTTPIRPWPESKFTSISQKELAVIGELLYNKAYNVQGASAGSLLARKQELENRFGIAMMMCESSLAAATAGGLSCIDGSAERGVRYIYRIRIQSDTQEQPSAILVVRATEPRPPLMIHDLQATFTDRKVFLEWSTRLHRGMYSSYFIERSADNKKFSRLNDLPYVQMSEQSSIDRVHFVDSLASNNQTYCYRIQGLTPFGELGPFSNVVSGRGKRDLQGKLIIRHATVEQSSAIKLTWEFPQELEAQIHGFVVTHSRNLRGQSTVLDTVAVRQREYKHIVPSSNNYYIVQAFDVEGTERARSLPFLVQVPDESPPGVPEGLNGIIDESGAATLTWTPGNEEDLFGYRVFRSNSREEELTEVTQDIFADTQYVDSLDVDVLNREVYYSLVAVDKNYNTSDYSEPIKLLRPDHLPPVAPVITHFDIGADSISLRWIESTSPDVKQTELIKTEVDEKLSRTIRTWYAPFSVTRFLDGSSVPGRRYQYKLVATDSAGNSVASSTGIFTVETGRTSPVTNLKSVVDRDARSILITWKNPSLSAKCLIYRKKNKEPFVIHETLPGNTESFVDKSIEINNVYIYKIQVCYANGARSVLSEAIEVSY